MLPILPWMPATALVLGMEHEDARNAAGIISTKTHAMAKALLTRNPPRKWDPVEIKFEDHDQLIEFRSTCMLDHREFKTSIHVNNEITLRENNVIALSLVETMEVRFDTYRNRTADEVPARTSCMRMAKLSVAIPQIIADQVSGKALRTLIEMPSAFDHALGSAKMLNLDGRRLFIESDSFKEQARRMHQKFQDSIPAF